MFSGIVEEAAPIVALKRDNGNLHLTLKSSFAHELKIDQSVAHNGVCLTVVNIEGDHYTVTAIQETLERSNLGTLSVGDKVNLERSMLMNGRLDGHIVQGHVDQTARCTKNRSCRRKPILYLHLRPQSRNGCQRLYDRRERIGYRERGKPHRMQLARQQFPSGDHSLHLRAYQFPPNRGRQYSEPRIRHYRQIHQPYHALRKRLEQNGYLRNYQPPAKRPPVRSRTSGRTRKKYGVFSKPPV